jgi:ParB-like chromosome segregation protein Spo0J
LELWKVHPSTLREQDVNARAMPKAMFERLAQTIARDKRLESLPLCAKTERGLEIISGHHRVRAATTAGISEMFALVDVTGLTRSQIAAKQLAHNAIEGQDNEQLLGEIYRQIEDAESKLEAFIDEKLDVEIPKVRIEGLDVEIDFKTVLLIFLPRVKERLDRAVEYLRSSGQRLDGVYIAADSDYSPLEKAVRKINEEYDVRVVADIIGKMADLALEACGTSVQGPERVHVKDLFGSAWIPKEAAAVVKDAVQKMIEAGDIGQTNRWQAQEYWAADYLQQ